MSGISGSEERTGLPGDFSKVNDGTLSQTGQVVAEGASGASAAGGDVSDFENYLNREGIFELTTSDVSRSGVFDVVRELQMDAPYREQKKASLP